MINVFWLFQFGQSSCFYSQLITDFVLVLLVETRVLISVENCSSACKQGLTFQIRELHSNSAINHHFIKSTYACHFLPTHSQGCFGGLFSRLFSRHRMRRTSSDPSNRARSQGPHASQGRGLSVSRHPILQTRKSASINPEHLKFRKSTSVAPETLASRKSLQVNLPTLFRAKTEAEGDIVAVTVRRQSLQSLPITALKIPEEPTSPTFGDAAANHVPFEPVSDSTSSRARALSPNEPSKSGHGSLKSGHGSGRGHGMAALLAPTGRQSPLARPLGAASETALSMCADGRVVSAVPQVRRSHVPLHLCSTAPCVLHLGTAHCTLHSTCSERDLSWHDVISTPTVLLLPFYLLSICSSERRRTPSNPAVSASSTPRPREAPGAPRATARAPPPSPRSVAASPPPARPPSLCSTPSHSTRSCPRSSRCPCPRPPEPPVSRRPCPTLRPAMPRGPRASPL